MFPERTNETIVWPIQIDFQDPEFWIIIDGELKNFTNWIEAYFDIAVFEQQNLPSSQ